MQRQTEIRGHPNVVSSYIFELASLCLHLLVCSKRFLRTEIGLLGYGRSLPEMMNLKQLGCLNQVNFELALSKLLSLAILDGKTVAAYSHRSGLTGT